MMRVHRDEDADLRELRGGVAVLGYGNQGAAHALNLRDSGVAVVVGQRPGSAFERALRDGFSPRPLAEAVPEAALVIAALPDDVFPELFRGAIAPKLRAGQALGLIHGFNVHFGRIDLPGGVDVVMVAPKGPGRLLRSAFAGGGGVAGLVATAQDATGRAQARALAWAKGIGCTRVGVIETTFAAETVCDLFGEQAVLCGGMIELMKAAFEVLCAAGYPPELAYFECVHEVKQIVDLVQAGGLAGMRRRISGTARFGGLTRGPQVIDDRVRAALTEALRDIESGAFAERFAADARQGDMVASQLAQREAEHGVESARARLAPLLGVAPDQAG